VCEERFIVEGVGVMVAAVIVGGVLDMKVCRIAVIFMGANIDLDVLKKLI